ncbi:MAG: Gldg family protein [Planctomycetaceae bacterium]
MKLRLHVINAIFKRNFQSYFSGVLGYLFIVAFVALGSFLAFSPTFFGNNLANLDQLNEMFPILLLFFVPAITMSAWADERKLGTDELLFTLPASDIEVLLGKYLAVLGVYTVALMFSLSHVIVLMILGNPDLGLMFTTYFGYWIAGAALLSAGMVASILTPSTTVAYVLGALLCAIPVFIDKLAPGSRLLQGLSISEQFRDFGLGMIPLGGVLYFVSLTALMLYVNLVLISRRHWLGGPHRGPMWLHYLVRALALAVALVSVNSVAGAVTRRIDLTSERLFSLSETTQKVLKSVRPEAPVLIRAFISPEVPRDYVSTRTSLIGLLRQFDQAGGKNVRVQIINTEKYTQAADDAKTFGIESQEVQTERGGRWTRDDVFMGVVVSGSADDQVIIPFFDKGTPVEYELTRSIRTVSQANRKKIGVLRTDAQATGGFDMQSFRQNPEWKIVGELKKQYDVKAVAPEELDNTDVEVLVAIMPSSLSDPQMVKLVEYVKRGKPTLIIDDPLPIFHSNLAPKQPKPRPGGMFGGSMPEQKSDNGEATKLCDALGIAWNSGESVWDNYDAHPEFRDWFNSVQLFDVVYITPANKAKFAFNPESNISKGLQEVMLFYPGQIKPRDNSRLEFEPLMRSSFASSTYEWDEYVQPGMMGGIGGLLMPPPKTMRESISPVIAARIRGTLPAASRDGHPEERAAPHEINAVFIADLDMISDTFFYIRDKNWQGIQLDNITFVLNTVDELAGDDAFLELRSRRPEHRTLVTVEEQTESAKAMQTAATQQAEKEADQKLNEARDRLRAEVDKIRKDTTLDKRDQAQKIETANEDERRRFGVEKQNIETDKSRRLKRIKNDTERKIRDIENSIRRWAILIPPIPALILGTFVFAIRAKGERQGIIPDRLVGKQKLEELKESKGAKGQ